MLKAFKYRISPTESQKVFLNKHIGAARFIFNLALETKTTAYTYSGVNLSCFDLIKQIPELKKECEWLKEVNSQSLQAPIKNLDNAFKRFFKGQGNFQLSTLVEVLTSEARPISSAAGGSSLFVR